MTRQPRNFAGDGFDTGRQRTATSQFGVSRRESHEFYADPDNQTPQGPPRRRGARLTEMVPVRFPPVVLDKVRRRAVEHELERDAS